MENVFRDYGRFENESNNQIICFNVTRTYLLCESTYKKCLREE